MQQRRLRLGDVLDDYCPRERRITNHVVVAMIEDTVKQTRCTTCDADHEYKQAKVPSARRRKTAVPAAQLVDGARPVEAVEAAELPDEVALTDDDTNGDEQVEQPDRSEQERSEQAERSERPERLDEVAAAPAAVVGEADSEAVTTDDREEWPVHRPLIRAQLPRPEGQTPERKAPDFTFRPGGGKFDQNRNNGQRHRGGHRQGRHAQGHSPSGQGNSRFGGQRGSGQGGQGGGFGQRQGNRSGQGGGGNRAGQSQGPGRGPRPGGGRKRGR